jgi:serine/threonine protein kinase
MTQYKKVGDTFQIKISDFGLSALKPKKSASLVWEKVGTVNTMAPEILQVWLLGVDSSTR